MSASASYQMGNMTGSRAFNHDSSQDSEKEYDRLRDLARSEGSKRGSCFDRSREAYQSGDGRRAKQLSEEGKAHGAKMDQYNKQASDFIFRENNAPGRVADDTIDLHGQFVEEAEDILEQRIRYAQRQGQSHLHVIVGKGNHSVNHVQKIKPRVEQVCQELGLQYTTEQNAGIMYINLQGGQAVMPPESSWGSHQQQGHHGGGGHQQQQQHGGQHQQQQGGIDNEEIEKLAKKLLPKVLRKLEGCCVVM
ncbi:smr domain-containing protein [Amylocarpus encephaloides]|uniref:Smr domain-containing protein n=1 Tax=Amylocarpus encephaloides TaxID=45428 RepID=A0A9P8CA46_9HELO|nr:smr domain-containing protein [Amylocarpus encephaloides]